MPAYMMKRDLQSNVETKQIVGSGNTELHLSVEIFLPLIQ
jgi:hypothetical protein